MHQPFSKRWHGSNSLVLLPSQCNSTNCRLALLRTISMNTVSTSTCEANSSHKEEQTSQVLFQCTTLLSPDAQEHLASVLEIIQILQQLTRLLFQQLLPINKSAELWLYITILLNTIRKPQQPNTDGILSLRQTKVLLMHTRISSLQLPTAISSLLFQIDWFHST